MKKSNKNRSGFTLAEVLITLGIIGVVAAVTIPTLITNNQTRIWDSGAKIFETKLSESLKIMNTQGTLNGHTTTEEFVNELAKHLKITKICNNDHLEDCFPKTITGIKNIIDIADNTTWNNDGSLSLTIDISNIKTAKDLGQDWNTNVVGIQLLNGNTALLAYNNQSCESNPYSNQITGLDCIATVYDVTGTEKPNKYSQDLRVLNASIADNQCLFKSNGKCITQIVPEGTGISRAECENLYEKGLVFGCFHDTDYWAGGAKICGGQSKIANAADLESLASYLYDSNSQLDLEKMVTLGFKAKTDFIIWNNLPGNTQPMGIGHNVHEFHRTSHRKWGYTNDNSGIMILCTE